MKRQIKTWIVSFWMFVLSIAGCIHAYAANNQMPVPEDKPLSLTVTMTYTDENKKDVALPGVTLEVLKVASLKVQGGSAEYILESAYASSKIDFAGMSAAKSQEAAKQLAELAQKQGEKGVSIETDAAGIAAFKNLTAGMYLVRQTASKDKTVKEMEPFLAAVPLAQKSEKGNSWLYEVKSYPKTELIKEPEGSIEVTKMVRMKDRTGNYVPVKITDSFQAGLFLDPKGEIPYGENNIRTITLTRQSSSTAKFDHLPKNTYYVFEVGKDGKAIMENGIYKAKVDATCHYDGNNAIKIDPDRTQMNGKITIYNDYDTPPDGERESEPPGDTPPGNDNPPGNNTPGGHNPPETVVKTGDTTNLAGYGAMLLGAAVIILIVLQKRRVK